MTGGARLDNRNFAFSRFSQFEKFVEITGGLPADFFRG
jgi:hypothetical protein